MNVAIVGGGITGLAAAYRLEQKNPLATITLFEQGERLGGKVMSDHIASLVVERGADSFLSRKPRGIALCEELGITDQIIGRRPENRQTFVKRFGRLHPLPEGLSGFVPTNLAALVDHSLLTAAGLKRLERESEVPAFQGTEDESLGAFMRRRLGREAFENIVEPLMSGIFAGDADRLSLLATYPHLRRIEQECGSLLNGLKALSSQSNEEKYPPFVSFVGGMSTLIHALQNALTRTEILTGAPVTHIGREDDRWQVTTNDATVAFDTVLMTTPAFVSGRIVANLDPVLAKLLANFPYASTAVVHLAFPRGKVHSLPRSYGYVVPQVEKSAILACSWSSQKWTGRAPQDTLLLRVFMGRFGEDPILEQEDDALIIKAITEAGRTLNISAAPSFQRVYRWPGGMPQYTLGHRERIAKLRDRLTHHPGLWMAGALFDGVGIPNCIASGEEAAEAMMEKLFV